MSCRSEYVAHSEEYRGYKIKIINDESPPNPFEDWDGEPPIAIYVPGYGGSGSIHEYATQYGNANEVPSLTKEQIKDNWPDLKDMILSEYEPTLLGLVRAYRGGYGYQGVLVDAVNEAIRQMVDGEYNSKRLQLLETVWRMAGFPAVHEQSTGYSQSDWCEVLAVATDKFLETTGCTKEQCEENDYELLRASIRLYGYWAWGDVYGYVISKDGAEIDDGSTWGYYGDYDNDDSKTYGGSLAEARSIVDHRIVEETHDHFQRVKAWIKNHVPLASRSPLAI